MASLRTKETAQKYRSDQLNKKWDPKSYSFDWKSNNIELFKYWALIPTNYPYDLVSEIHHLLVPKRIYPSYREVSKEERAELMDIKDILKGRYDFIIENLPSKITIESHYHLHFIKMKDEQV
jgi:diadenosine tetraphosphate (Ap4A) HIT family hydrolase